MERNMIKEILELKGDAEIESFIKNRVDELKADFEQKFLPSNRDEDDKYVSMRHFTSPSNVVLSTRFYHPKYYYISIDTRNPDFGGYFFDDEHDVYRFLIDNFRKKCAHANVKNEEKLRNLFFQSVTKSVFDYIGGPKVEGGVKERNETILRDMVDFSNNKISFVKSSKHAVCLERAAIVHQLFQFVGIRNGLMNDWILNDGKLDAHALNFIRIGDKDYLFDTALVNFENEETINNSVVSDSIKIRDDMLEMCEKKGEGIINHEAIENFPLERKIIGPQGNERIIVYDVHAYNKKKDKEKNQNLQRGNQNKQNGNKKLQNGEADPKSKS